MALFDHLVGNRHNNVWHFNTESLGYLEVVPSRVWLSSGAYSAALLRERYLCVATRSGL